MRNVALFVDIDNICISLKEKGLRVDWDILLSAIKKCFGEDSTIVVGKAYFNRKEDEKGERYCYALYERGIQPIYSPTYGFETARKSLSDPLMICDIMETLYELDHIQYYVVVSSDKDFIPVIKNLIRKGKKVLVIGLEENNKYLVNECYRLGVDFIDYIKVKELVPRQF